MKATLSTTAEYRRRNRYYTSSMHNGTIFVIDANPMDAKFGPMGDEMMEFHRIITEIREWQKGNPYVNTQGNTWQFWVSIDNPHVALEFKLRFG